MAFTIGPHHASSTVPTKVNSFHISPSFGCDENGILLETSANAMTRPMTMTPMGGDKKTPGTKNPKEEAWKIRRKRTPRARPRAAGLHAGIPGNQPGEPEPPPELPAHRPA